jgi:hypothetical protein
MTKRSGNLDAVLTLVSMSTLGFLACTSLPVATAPGTPLPMEERAIFVELPASTHLTADSMRAHYRRGRRTIFHVRQRCISDLSAGPCTGTRDVRISAVEGAIYINPTHAPDHPQLIAWIENLGDKVTYDGIEPMTQAVYALVVDSLPIANPRIMRVRFPAIVAGGRSEIRADSSGHVYPCHNYRQPYISDADFQPCSPYGPLGSAPLHSSSAHAIFVGVSTGVALSSSDPTWFSCSSGCCSASAHQVYQARSVPSQSPYFPFGHLLALGPSASY